MECTAEEIAEKRRIALERLKAKKDAIAKAKEALNSKSNEKESMTLATSKKIPINPYQQSRAQSHPYGIKATSTITTNVNVKKEEPKVIVISCNCYIITESRFEVKPSGYSNPLINVFRTIPSRGYGMFI